MAYLGSDGDLRDVTAEEVERAERGRGNGMLLEEGWYRCALIEDEVKVKSWGTGLSLQFQIIDGDFANYRVFDFLCLRHSTSEQAQRIARAKLKALGIAAGAKDPENIPNTDELHGKPVMVEVKREPQSEARFADEDGCKPKVNRILSVSAWKEKHRDEPLPGVKKAAKAPTKNLAVTSNPQASLYADDEIPF